MIGVYVELIGVLMSQLAKLLTSNQSEGNA
jgi:hypothetical protein